MRRRRGAEPVPLLRSLVILDGTAADVFHDLIVLHVEPLFEYLQAPILGPHVYVRVPALQFSAENLVADLLQDLIGVRRVFVVRHEIERRPHLIQRRFRGVVVIDRSQPIAERLLRSHDHGAAIGHR